MSKKFNQKFLECISQIVYDNPKIVKTFNVNRGKYGFVHFEKQAPETVVIVDGMGYQVYFEVKDTQTKLYVQPIILTRNGWMEIDEEQSEILTGKDHLLFKPLPAIINKSHEVELQKKLNKIQEMFVKKQTTDIDPLATMYNEIKEEAIKENTPHQKVGAFGKGNPELMDFTKEWAEIAEEEEAKEKTEKKDKPKRKSPWSGEKEDE